MATASLAGRNNIGFPNHLSSPSDIHCLVLLKLMTGSQLKDYPPTNMFLIFLWISINTPAELSLLACPILSIMIMETRNN